MLKKICQRLTTAVGILILCFIFAPILKVDAKVKTYTWEDYTYWVETDSYGYKKAYITEYNGQEKNLVIPDTINSIKVRCLPGTYKHPDKIKTLTIPQYIYEIGSYNFQSLNNLEAIYVKESNADFKSKDGILFDQKEKRLVCYPPAKQVISYTIPTKITSAYHAFENNKYLKKIVIQGNLEWSDSLAQNSNIQTVLLSDQMKEIGHEAFSGCKKLRTITMGKNIRIIHGSAFKNCVSLKKITLPEGLSRIDSYAFMNCKSLKELRIPGSVYFIDSKAFKGCPAKIKTASYLEKRKFDKDNQYTAKIPIRHYKTGKIKSYRLGTISYLRPEDKTITIKRGQSKKLHIIGYRYEVKKGIVDPSVLKYTSSDSKIARVSKHGNIKAYKKGTVKIKIDLRPQMPTDKGRQKYCYVTIKVK